MAEIINDKKEIARFIGQVAKVQTAVDGGFRIWIDGGNQDITDAAFLMPFATTPGALVEIVFYQSGFIPLNVEKESEDAISRTTAKRRK